MTGRCPSAVTPRARTLPGNWAARAAINATMLAMLPPLTNSPPHPGGYPTSSAIHAIACRSISVATGESDQAPTLGFTAAASRSARIPSGAGDEVI